MKANFYATYTTFTLCIVFLRVRGLPDIGLYNDIPHDIWIRLFSYRY